MSSEIVQNKPTPFWFLGILSTFSLLTYDLYQPALPTITQYFNTSPALGQLTLSLFFFVFGLSQLIWGPLIDHYGRRKTLAGSLVIFLIATIACIASVNIEMLIAARALQGFAICCVYVIAFSSSRDYEDSTERARMLSYLSMIVAVSPLFAPIIGSIILMHYDWQTTFLVMGLIGLILLVLAKSVLHESVYWQKAETTFLLRASFATYKKIFTHRRLWLAIFIITASYSCVMIIVINASFLVIDNLAISPFNFSLLFASNGVMLVAGNYLGIRLREKKSLLWNIRLGSALMLLGSIAMCFLFYIQGLSLISLAPTLLINLGVSLTNPPTFSIALTDYQQHAGTATAVLNMLRTTISAIIGGLVGGFIGHYPSLLVISLFACTFISLLTSFFITES